MMLYAIAGLLLSETICLLCIFSHFCELPRFYLLQLEWRFTNLFYFSRWVGLQRIWKGPSMQNLGKFWGIMIFMRIQIPHSSDLDSWNEARGSQRTNFMGQKTPGAGRKPHTLGFPAQYSDIGWRGFQRWKNNINSLAATMIQNKRRSKPLLLVPCPCSLWRGQASEERAVSQSWDWSLGNGGQDAVYPPTGQQTYGKRGTGKDWRTPTPLHHLEDPLWAPLTRRQQFESSPVRPALT